MPTTHTAGQFVRSVIIAFILFHIIRAEANDTIKILQPTRDLMPLVGTRTMMQDSEGYVWYGTVEGGLCRDNGYQIDVFRNDRHNPRRIGQSNGILSMCEDAAGNIVFGTRKNIFVLDKRDYSIRQLDKSIPDGRVEALSHNGDGVIHAVTENGCYSFDRNYRLTGKTHTRSFPPAETTCRFTDIYGNEWTGGINMENCIRIKDNGGIEKREATELPVIFKDIRPDFIEADGGYIGHTNTEVFWTKTIEARPKDWHKLLTTGTRIGCVAVSKGGWLYIGDAKGLYRCRYANGAAESGIETVTESLGNIRKMAAAPSGGIYFITPHCELAHCDDRGKVTVVQRGTESKALAVAPDGKVWTTDWFGNVFRFDSQLRKLVVVADAGIDSGDPVNAMTCDANGNLWLVTDKMIKEYTTDGRRRTIHNNNRYIGVSQFLDIGSKDGHIIVTCSDAQLVVDPDYRCDTPHRPSLTTASIDGNT
ncbi:MAG: SMP-30/gluconolactonase/LRE family protein, partial [Prevotella sp.]|nr:SMP-30/gluconolactonase/LRE family protein [Prevotella sp.]